MTWYSRSACGLVSAAVFESSLHHLGHFPLAVKFSRLQHHLEHLLSYEPSEVPRSSLLLVFTSNGYFPDVLTETKFCSFQIVTSEALTRVSEALPAEAPSFSRRPSSRLHLHWKIPDPVRLGWITETSWSDFILAFFQYSAALKESCSVMRHEPYYTNPMSCAQFSLILSFFL